MKKNMPNQRSARFHTSTTTTGFFRHDLPSVVVFVVTRVTKTATILFSSTRNERKQERCHRTEIDPNHAIVGGEGGVWRKNGNPAAPLIMIHHSCLSLR